MVEAPPATPTEPATPAEPVAPAEPAPAPAPSPKVKRGPLKRALEAAEKSIATLTRQRNEVEAKLADPATYSGPPTAAADLQKEKLRLERWTSRTPKRSSSRPMRRLSFDFCIPSARAAGAKPACSTTWAK